MQRNLIKVVESLGRPKILLVGDLMLDRYVFGDADRISPEAPIQVLRAISEEQRLGGAGGVANNLAALGARVSVCGVVGRDAEGRQVVDMLRSLKAGVSGVLRLAGRPTTLKTRYVGRAQHRIPQQVLRVDKEVDTPLKEADEGRIIKGVERAIAAAACVVISDYGKGVLTPAVTRRIICLAKRAGKPVLVDPRRSNDYSQYRGATLLVLNRMETAQAAGESSTDGASVRKAGQRLVRSLALGALVVTMDKDGALLIEQGRSARVVPTRARVIFDNAGAGDMFIAALAPVLSSGRSLLESVRVANVAAGLEVEKFGAQTVSRQEIVRDILEESHHAGSKQRDLGTLLEDVARHRMLGQTVVFTNGCFDLIHQGHIQLLNFAGAQGDVLIVGLNSDRSVRMNKGPGRPYCSAKERGRVLAGLEAVDYVVIFDTKRPIKLIKALQPDILVKGGDYNLKGVVGHDVVESYGGRVVLAPLVKNLSTTDLVQRIQANGNGPRSRKATKKTRATKRRAAK